MTSVTFKLDDLYNTKAAVTLPDGKVITVRTLTDAEVSVRDLAATKAASVARVELRDTESQKYKDLIVPLALFGRDTHMSTIMSVAERRIGLDVVEDFPIQHIPFPDDATEEEKEDVMVRREEHEAKIRHERSTESSHRLEVRREELRELDDDEMLERAGKALIDATAFGYRVEEFYSQTIYMSCRDSEDKPVFEMDAVHNHGKSDGLNEQVYKKLLEVYGEIDNADPWVLQKHP